MPKKNTEVYLFRRPESGGGTELLVSEDVLALLVDRGKGLPTKIEQIRMRKKLEQYCNTGFELYVNNSYGPIKREYGCAYGLRLGQYRLAGFFSEGYAVFVAVEHLAKKSQKNTARLNAMYKRVDAIGESDAWVLTELED